MTITTLITSKSNRPTARFDKLSFLNRKKHETNNHSPIKQSFYSELGHADSEDICWLLPKKKWRFLGQSCRQPDFITFQRGIMCKYHIIQMCI